MLVRLYKPNRNEKAEIEGMDIQLCVDFETKIKQIDFCYPITFKDKTYLCCEIKDDYRDYYALSEELEEAFKKQKGDI